MPGVVPNQAVCASCNASNAPEAKFCRTCGTEIAEVPVASASLEPAGVPWGPAGRWPVIAGAAAGVIAILLVVGLVVFGSDGESAAPSPRPDSSADAATAPSGGAGASLTTRPVSAGAVTPTTTTLPPTTSTLPPTTTLPPTMTASPSAAAVPTVPAAPEPLDAPGNPQVMSDPLPSGLAVAAVRPSFLVAQQLADALALADWPAGRALDPGMASLSDEAFVDGYGGLDRASLLLIEARPSGAGFEMLVVSVAVELDGSQTSLYCLTWIADPISGTIDQGGGSKLTTQPGNVSPEAIRDDPVALGEVGRCVWS